MKQLIILLEGGFIPITILNGDVDKIKKLLLDKVHNKSDEIIFINECYFIPAKVTGWYFTAVPEAAVEKMIKFMDKKMPNKDEGDDWKNND
jgi:hypothetical protein